MWKGIFSTIGSFASLLGVILMIRPEGQAITLIQVALVALALFFLASTLWQDYLAWRGQGRRVLSKEVQIHDYMYKWVSTPGRTVIFSHNLSWANTVKMKSLLRDKAKSKELCVCLPNRVPLTDELEKEGAEICDYAELSHTPQASFTIVRKGRLDSRVAVGRRIKDKHVIEEFSVGEHPVFHVANDLTDIIIKFNDWRKKSTQVKS